MRVSDPLGAIAYPNAATLAAIDLDVLRCRQPGPIHLVGVTEGGTAHLLSVQLKYRIAGRSANDVTNVGSEFARVKSFCAILPPG